MRPARDRWLHVQYAAVAATCCICMLVAAVPSFAQAPDTELLVTQAGWYQADVASGRQIGTIGCDGSGGVDPTSPPDVSLTPVVAADRVVSTGRRPGTSESPQQLRRAGWCLPDVAAGGQTALQPHAAAFRTDARRLAPVVLAAGGAAGGGYLTMRAMRDSDCLAACSVYVAIGAAGGAAAGALLGWLLVAYPD